MYAQFSEGFPGVVVEDYASTSTAPATSTRAWRTSTPRTPTTMPPNMASAVTMPLAFTLCWLRGLDNAVALKGQVTGPISWGFAVADGAQWAIYDDTLAEAIARHLRLKAAWQHKELSRISRNVIIFLDEPYLTSLGSAFVSLPPEKVKALLEETLGGISGLRGVHCCGNTDWSLLLGLPINILSFDAYNYAGALSAYTAEIRSFIGNGGAIAWASCPTRTAWRATGRGSRAGAAEASRWCVHPSGPKRSFGSPAVAGPSRATSARSRTEPVDAVAWWRCSTAPAP